MTMKWRFLAIALLVTLSSSVSAGKEILKWKGHEKDPHP